MPRTSGRLPCLLRDIVNRTVHRSPSAQDALPISCPDDEQSLAQKLRGFLVSDSKSHDIDQLLTYLPPLFVNQMAESTELPSAYDTKC